jgi:AcrR family transcriptional regulator
MCPKTSQQIKDIRSEKRQLILDSALVVFAQKGYHAASIANIATEAKISKGLIYNYFESKEAVLKETISSGLEYMFKEYRFDPEHFTTEEFSALIDRTFDLLDEDFSYWKIYFSVLMQTDVMILIQDKLMEVLFPIIESFAVFLGKLGYEKPLMEARYFGATLDGLSMNYIIDPENFPRDYCIKRLKSIYKLPQ